MVYRMAFCLLGLLAFERTLAAPPKDAARTEPEPDYDNSALIDSEAIVMEVKDGSKENPFSGVKLIVKTDSDATMTVYLGPLDFVRSFEITFKKGDRIRFAGSKVKFDGAYLVLAREVRKESATLFLRDTKGAPYWRTSTKPSA